MKYIKLFENHNQYYYSITDEENKNSITYKKNGELCEWEDFKVDELNIIIDALPKSENSKFSIRIDHREYDSHGGEYIRILKNKDA